MDNERGELTTMRICHMSGDKSQTQKDCNETHKIN